MTVPKGIENLAAAIIDDGYDVTIRDVYRALKCSRSYATKHLRGHVPQAYASDAAAVAVVATYGAPERVGSGGTLYSRPELDAMARSATVLRRTRLVYLTGLLEPGCSDEVDALRLEASGALSRGDLLAYRSAVASYRGLVASRAPPEWRWAASYIERTPARGPHAWVDEGDAAPGGMAGLEALTTSTSMILPTGREDMP